MEGFWGQIGLRFAFVRPAARKKVSPEGDFDVRITEYLLVFSAA